ncbi:MAG: ABC transporter permease [Oscillospiraceae bacterium]|nr:ABC transporter permease [Oscillospiraceae bacterium]
MLQKLRNHDFVWPLSGCVLLYLLIGLVSGKFNVAILLSTMRLCTFALLLGLGQMLVVTSGDGAIDLSQQYILTLTAFISCALMKQQLILGLLIALAVGALCGLLNGLINTKLRVPAMITTLATGYIYFTIIQIMAPRVKTLPSSTFVKFVNFSIGGFSMMSVVCILVAAALAVVLYRSPYGRRLHAVGQKKLAAHYAGIRVDRTVIIAFVINGALCGLAGVLCGAYCGGASADMGSTYFLPSVAATFVGGTAASGGKSSVLGVCFGALMMSFMSTFLNAAHIAAGLQNLIQGLFLVLILVASVRTAAKRK